MLESSKSKLICCEKSAFSVQIALDLGANLVLSVHLEHSMAQAHAGLGDAFFKSDTGSLLLSVIARGEAVVAE
ncbi:TPA: hypothetical protein I6202_003521 [Vibrio cholerae]|nr:hypothetical protein [Vibrio cholerae]